MRQRRNSEAGSWSFSRALVGLQGGCLSNVGWVLVLQSLSGREMPEFQVQPVQPGCETAPSGAPWPKAPGFWAHHGMPQSCKPLDSATASTRQAAGRGGLQFADLPSHPTHCPYTSHDMGSQAERGRALHRCSGRGAGGGAWLPAPPPARCARAGSRLVHHPWLVHPPNRAVSGPCSQALIFLATALALCQRQSCVRWFCSGCE